MPEAPPTPVDRELEDGDPLDFGDGAYAVHAPGHTPGSIAVHLPRHGVLFTGDCVAAVGPVMPGVFNVDRDLAVATFHRLAALAPEVACFGHGDPLTVDTARTLAEAAAQTPRARPRSSSGRRVLHTPGASSPVRPDGAGGRRAAGRRWRAACGTRTTAARVTATGQPAPLPVPATRVPPATAHGHQPHRPHQPHPPDQPVGTPASR